MSDLDIKKMSIKAPFPADEEKPYIFVSYAHADRNIVFPIIAKLYEKGWRLWYDEGLEIGDNYYETLKEHVKCCRLFLLFSSDRSTKSEYILNYEIPQAIEFKKQILMCRLYGNDEFPYFFQSVKTTTEELEQRLKRMHFLQPGTQRRAKGHSVNISMQNYSKDLDYDFDYLYHLRGVKLLRYKGNKKEVEVPEFFPPFSNYPVIAMEKTFLQANNIETIRIPGSVRCVSIDCFWGCKNLKDIYIPSSVTEIAYDSLWYTGHLSDDSAKVSLFPLHYFRKLRLHCPKESAAWLYGKRLKKRNWLRFEVELDDGIDFYNGFGMFSYAYCSFSGYDIINPLKIIRIMERKYTCALTGSGKWDFYEPEEDRYDFMTSIFLYNCQKISEGTRMKRISSCSCFIAFIDKKYFKSEYYDELLEAIRLKKNIALYILENCVLPEQIGNLRNVHHLRFDTGSDEERTIKLVNWISKWGCKKHMGIPDFEIACTSEGIKLLHYTGEDEEICIEDSYDGLPVAEICEGAFFDCVTLRSVKVFGPSIRMEGNIFGDLKKYITVSCSKDSLCWIYCEKNDIPHIPM